MMKTRIYLISLIIFIAPLLASAETARVITKENAIRQECRFFSPVRAQVKYDDQLTILAKEGDWYRVSFKGVRGCIHKSAIQERRFELTGVRGTQGQPASKDEVSLAGKGFNPQVENSFKNKNPQLNFSLVDRIEEYTVSEENLRMFIKDGGLVLPE